MRIINARILICNACLPYSQDSRVAIYQRMWAYMQSQPEVFVSGSKEGIEKVRNSSGKYAFLLESTTNEYTNNMLPCNTMKVGPKLDSKGFGIATPIGSDIRYHFDSFLKAMVSFKLI